MYVGLCEASRCAVTSVCSADPGKNCYRFGFWSTTPIFAKRRHTSAQNGLVRGLARRQWSGHPQLVLATRRTELQREQRPSSACTRVPAWGQFSHFSSILPVAVFQPFFGWTERYPLKRQTENG